MIFARLQPHEDRAVMIAEINIDKDGKRLSHHIERALIRSHARLTYEQVQAVFDGTMDEADCNVPHGMPSRIVWRMACA